MKRVFILALFLQSALAQEAAVQFEQANRLYRGGDYAGAAGLYEQLISQGYETPEVYYNLGNACFKLDRFPAAILNYERARRLAPGDEDILHNLRLAQLRVVDRIEPLPKLFLVDWWERLADTQSSAGWGVAMVASLWGCALCGMALISLRSLHLRRTAAWLASVFVVVGVLSLAGMTYRIREEKSRTSAVVFSPSVPVKSAPDRQSTDLFMLHEGVTVELIDSVGAWKKIRLADGKIGWLSGESVEGI